MNKVSAVTFDCAQTLVRVDWRPAQLAVECAIEVGLAFDEGAAADCYDRLLRSRWSEFRELNLTRDESLTEKFWFDLTHQWAQETAFHTDCVAEILLVAEKKLFGADSSVFSVYDDVVPCLQSLRRAEIPMAVVSNWDISLHKTLRSVGLADYFDVVVASMEEGYEKPDPRIFNVAIERLGVLAQETVHVGDNPVDDLMGARGVGAKGYVIDRENSSEANVYLSSLLELPARLGV